MAMTMDATAMVVSTLSMRPRIFVTGPPGVGKTTLIISVLERLKKAQYSNLRIHGFYTRELRDHAMGERVGFEAIMIDGRKARLASTASISSSSSIAAMPRVGKYNVHVSQFESLVLPELALRGQQEAGTDRNSSKLFVIDEVGKMELFSSAFFPAVWEILNSRADAVLGTIPVPKHGRQIAEVEMIEKRADVSLYNLTKSNRDTLANAVFSDLNSLLKTN